MTRSQMVREVQKRLSPMTRTKVWQYFKLSQKASGLPPSQWRNSAARTIQSGLRDTAMDAEHIGSVVDLHAALSGRPISPSRMAVYSIVRAGEKLLAGLQVPNTEEVVAIVGGPPVVAERMSGSLGETEELDEGDGDHDGDTDSV